MSAQNSAPGPQQARALLAPGGALRAAINFGNAALAQRDPHTGEAAGVSVALARALAVELEVPCELLAYEAAGQVFADRQHWNLAFLAIDPVRAEQLAFTPAYVQISACYVVHAQSELRRPEDVDQPGRRIAVGRGAAYDLHLTRSLRQAQLERFSTAAEAFRAFESEPLDAAAGVRRVVRQYADARGDLRVMEQDFLSIDQALCVPQAALAGLEAGMAWLCEWIESVKQNGFVADHLRLSGQEDATVAPPASPSPQT